MQDGLYHVSSMCARESVGAGRYTCGVLRSNRLIPPHAYSPWGNSLTIIGMAFCAVGYGAEAPHR